MPVQGFFLSEHHMAKIMGFHLSPSLLVDGYRSKALTAACANTTSGVR